MYICPEPPEGGFTLPLNPGRLYWQLEVLGWDRAELVHRLGVSSQKVASWQKGRSFVPNHVAVWLEMLARMIVANPTPLLWEHDPGISAIKHHHQDEDEDEAA